MFDTDYQLEYSESYSGTVHQEISIEEYQYCTSLRRAFESLISESYTNLMINHRKKQYYKAMEPPEKKRFLEKKNLGIGKMNRKYRRNCLKN